MAAVTYLAAEETEPAKNCAERESRRASRRMVEKDTATKKTSSLSTSSSSTPPSAAAPPPATTTTTKEAEMMKKKTDIDIAAATVTTNTTANTTPTGSGSGSTVASGGGSDNGSNCSGGEAHKGRATPGHQSSLQDKEMEKQVVLASRHIARELTKTSAIEKYISTCILDEEDEAHFADFDSELPHFLSRTFFSQDAKFFFLIFTTFLFFSVLILFMIQANCAWQSNQLLELLGREEFSQDIFYLHYYEMPDARPVATPGLRVNTSYFVH
ncbi:uncharacterized protein LOC115223901 isoform X1 [Argonauta hians]